MSTVKPLDRDAILKAASETRGLVVAEEHHLTGGLGSTIAAFLAEKQPTPMRFVCMPDEFAVVGPTVPLRAKYGLSADGVVAACRGLLGTAK
jgi:transketolase